MLTCLRPSPQVCAYAAFFEHRLQQGQKAIIHLEAFVARFMALYKRCVLEFVLRCVVACLTMRD